MFFLKSINKKIKLLEMRVDNYVNVLRDIKSDQKIIFESIADLSENESSFSYLEKRISDLENQMKKDVVIHPNSESICMSYSGNEFAEPQKQNKTKLRNDIETLIFKILEKASDNKGLYQQVIIDLVKSDFKKQKQEEPSESYVRSIIYKLMKDNKIQKTKNKGESRYRYSDKNTIILKEGYDWFNQGAA